VGEFKRDQVNTMFLVGTTNTVAQTGILLGWNQLALPK